MLRKIWLGFWFLVSIAMLLIVLPIAVSQGNPIGIIALGALLWGAIGYVCFGRLKKHIAIHKVILPQEAHRLLQSY